MPLDYQPFSYKYPSLPQRESTEDFFNNLIRPTFDKTDYKNCNENDQTPMPAIAESVGIEELSPSSSSMKSRVHDDKQSVSDFKDSINNIREDTVYNDEIAVEKLDQTTSDQNHIPVKSNCKFMCKLLPLFLLPILAYGLYFLIIYLRLFRDCNRNG